MKCEDAAELVSTLCDGERIPREAAEHIGACEACQARLNAYSTMGVELRRLASLEETKEVKARSWEKERRSRLSGWQKGGKTMRIPRFAFAAMLVIILLLSGSLVLVRARSGSGGPVLLLTYKLPPDGNPAYFAITTDSNTRTNHATFSTEVASGVLNVYVRFISYQGERVELGVMNKYQSAASYSKGASAVDLAGISEEKIWIDPGEKLRIPVQGLGQIELSGEFMDHMPALDFSPKETLDPQESEFRIVSPVLIRGKEVIFNGFANAMIDSETKDSAVMFYVSGEGRYIISTVPFDDAIEENVKLGQIRFSLDGQVYMLLTAVPSTRSQRVWVKHEAQYKLSDHMQGASNEGPMFLTGSLSRLMEAQIDK